MFVNALVRHKVMHMARSTAYIETSRHSVYYFRIRVPLSARSAIACTHIRRSLKTKCRREAVLRGAALLGQVEPLFEAAKRGDIVDVQALTWRENGKSLKHNPSPKTGSNELGEGCLKLSEVWQRYKREQQLEGVREKTIYDKEAQVSLLVRIVGDIPMRNVDRKVAQQFKEKALKLPPRINLVAGQSVGQLIANATQTISVTTFNNYVKNLTTVFKYGLREGYCDSNPFDGLKVKQRVKASTQRGRFSDAELSILLGSEEYPAKEHKLPCRYWLPYLGLYTGARLNELCQLYLDDFVTVNGIDCIYIREGRPDQRLKSLSSERLIPIHSELKRIGLLDYIAQKKADGSERLFPELGWNDNHGYSKAPSKWFNRYITGLGLKCDPERKDFHSFRHTVADHLKQQGVPESLVGGLLGHTTGGITFGRYGKNWEPQGLVPVVEALSF